MFPDLSCENILIIDDEPSNLEVAEATLELLYNADVVTASNGQSALDTLTAEITIILCDLMMPGMTGYDLLPELRKRTRMPVIALTASAMTHDREQALAAGFDGFISKPFEADRLAADISACIAEIRAKQSQSERAVPVVAAPVVEQTPVASTGTLLPAAIMPNAPQQPNQPAA